MEIWEIRDLKRRTIKSCASFHSKVGAIEAYTVYASIAPTFERNEAQLLIVRRFMCFVDLY